jgi:hypothetical protein
MRCHAAGAGFPSSGVKGGKLFPNGGSRQTRVWRGNARFQERGIYAASINPNLHGVEAG